MAEPSGKKLDSLYKLAWVRGLKTTYYLRSLGATHVEKSTAFDGKLNAVKTDPIDGAIPGKSSALSADSEGKACLIDDPTCEACQ
jgi:ribonucleoside-diphosphate reductase alpha chain